jgi:hypothetical protein
LQGITGRRAGRRWKSTPVALPLQVDGAGEPDALPRRGDVVHVQPRRRRVFAY